MKTVFVKQTHVKSCNASVKPLTDFEDVLEKLGARNIGICRFMVPGYKICTAFNMVSTAIALACIPRGGVLFLQYPLQPAIRKLVTKARKRHCKVVLLVHDINELRNDPIVFGDLLPAADRLIVHTPNMAQWVKATYNQPNTETLGIFDYITPSATTLEVSATQCPPYEIAFAGNLSKAAFLRLLDFNPADIRMVLYGKGIDDETNTKTFVDYRGACLPDELPAKIASCKFGLVWDGDSLDGCTGDFGNYLRYNAPYKLSSYICSGLPLIVWSEMATAGFIKEHNIGITIDRLTDLPEILKSIGPDEYQVMRDNVADMRSKVMSGFFYERAIRNTIDAITQRQRP